VRVPKVLPPSLIKAICCEHPRDLQQVQLINNEISRSSAAAYGFEVAISSGYFSQYRDYKNMTHS